MNKFAEMSEKTSKICEYCAGDLEGIQIELSGYLFCSDACKDAYAKMSEKKTSKKWKPGLLISAILCYVALFIMYMVGIALFGNWFEADKSELNHIAKAQEKISSALYVTYDYFGRLDVRKDGSVYAYIQKKNYMTVSYPDRDAAITYVGKAWCEDKVIEKITFISMPKVVLRDIQTGEDLGGYRCLLHYTNKK